MSAAGDMLGKAIRDSRQTQHSVARALGIDGSNVNKMCQGNQPISLHTALQLERVLDITAESLLVTQLYDKIRDAREEMRNGIHEASRASKRWTPDEDQFLRDHRDMDNREAAEFLGRTTVGVYRRRVDMGLPSVGATQR